MRSWFGLRALAHAAPPPILKANDAAELLEHEEDELVDLARAAVGGGFTGKTHVVATVVLEGRGLVLLDALVPLGHDWKTLRLEAARLHRWPVWRTLCRRDDFVRALRAVGAPAEVLADLARDPTPGRFHAVAAHPDNLIVGEVRLHSIERTRGRPS